MRTATKLTMTTLFTAGLLGLGAGTASAGTVSDRTTPAKTVTYQACTQEQTASGLLGLNLGLNLLSQCTAIYNA